MFKVIGGWTLAFAVVSLRQDYLGKEAYIRYAQENWIDPSITVPWALISLILGIYFSFIHKDKKGE